MSQGVGRGVESRSGGVVFVRLRTGPRLAVCRADAVGACIGLVGSSSPYDALVIQRRLRL
jgi:hypothetical protein